jgi:hypothetical protein
MTVLDALLDSVATALLSGDFAELARVTPQIDAATVDLMDHHTARRLDAKARRNARLLEAAMRGVKAARLRMAEVQAGPTLTTYNMRGQKALIPALTTDPIRRA